MLLVNVVGSGTHLVHRGSGLHGRALPLRAHCCSGAATRIEPPSAVTRRPPRCGLRDALSEQSRSVSFFCASIPQKIRKALELQLRPPAAYRLRIGTHRAPTAHTRRAAYTRIHTHTHTGRQEGGAPARAPAGAIRCRFAANRHLCILVSAKSFQILVSSDGDGRASPTGDG